MNPWPAALQEWEEIIAAGRDAALALLTEDTPRGRRLRQSNPFPGILDPRERDTIFQQYESLTT